MKKGKDLIVVTGATGRQGGAVARELLARKHRVRAITRKPESEPARALAAAGAEVVRPASPTSTTSDASRKRSRPWAFRPT